MNYLCLQFCLYTFVIILIFLDTAAGGTGALHIDAVIRREYHSEILEQHVRRLPGNLKLNDPKDPT